MISEHQEKIQKCLRELNSLNILEWTYEQKRKSFNVCYLALFHRVIWGYVLDFFLFFSLSLIQINFIIINCSMIILYSIEKIF